MFIELDREREVRLRSKAISQIEKKFKKPFTVLMGQIPTLLVEEQVYMLYQGLRHEDPQLTVEQTMELVDAYIDLKAVTEALVEAALDAYGTTREEAEEFAREQEANPMMAATEPEE